MGNFVEMAVAKMAAGLDEAPVWVIASYYLLMMLFVWTQISISYTHGSVVATLAMVEDPSPTAMIVDGEAPPPYADDPDTKPPHYQEEEVLLVHSKPITSSNRGTVRHLRSVAGKGAGFRGLGVALLHGLLTHLISNLVFQVMGGEKIAAGLGFILSQMLLYRLNMLWTHIVISTPSSKRFYQRLILRGPSKKAILPTFGWACVHIAIPVILTSLINVLGLEHDMYRAHHDNHMACRAAAKGAIVMLAALALLLFLYLPANVALTRCQAALLAEHEEPIVPLDRTFGGYMNLEASYLRLKDAWRSFDWNARVRLIKVYVRTALYQLLATIFFVTCGIMVVAAWVLVDKH